jgi:hypothetical protein
VGETITLEKICLCSWIEESHVTARNISVRIPSVLHNMPLWELSVLLKKYSLYLAFSLGLNSHFRKNRYMAELMRHLYLLGKFYLTSKIEWSTQCSPLRIECVRQKNNLCLSAFSNMRKNLFRKNRTIVQNWRDTGNC